MTAYYNEIEPYAAEWLRNLISQGLIAPGDVDTRSIVDVRPEDLAGYTQCHFFAGIGGWSYAARLAGWPDDRPLWTGSCPCQPFSVAGKGEGQADARHLWPVFHALICACRPDVVMGEQVAAAVGKHWLDGVCADLEGIGYAVGAAVVPACAVDAPHRRDRLWFVADASGSERWPFTKGRGHVDHWPNAGRQEASGRSELCSEGALADTFGAGLAQRECVTGIPREMGSEPKGQDTAYDDRTMEHPGSGRHWPTEREIPARRNGTFDNGGQSPWRSAEWLAGADGKARRVEPGIRLLAHGVPARVAKLRAFGNAIVPQVATEVIGAYLDAEHIRLTEPSSMTHDEGIFA